MFAMRKNKFLLAVVCILCLSLPVPFLAHQTASLSTAPASSAIEIPAPVKGRPSFIIKHKGYTVSYNSSTKLPNWVAWKLTPDRLVENYSRSNKFLPDPALPASQAVTTDDYKRSGWDRGHMCPAADNRWDWKAMDESFYMTNICPQHRNLNRGDWKELEEACNEWAKQEGAVYIVCGPILYNQKHKTIGYHQVVVPEAFYKVVLCLGKHTKAIGFIYKNNAGNKPLDSYVNTVDQVERITGIDFFPALPDNIESKVESHSNLKDWKFPE
jgi:endonuclease G